MINKKDITNVAKRMLRQHRGLEDPQIIHPQRDWLIGIGVSVLLFSLIVWWSVSSYIKHSNTATDTSTEVVSTDTVYREGQVNAALEFFSEKNKKFNELMGDIPVLSEVVEPAVEEGETNESEEEGISEEVIEEVVEIQENVVSDSGTEESELPE